MKVSDILVEMEPSDVRNTAYIINKSFNKLGIIVEFGTHAGRERLGNNRRESEITVPELISVFKKVYDTYGKELRALHEKKAAFAAIIKDRMQQINIPIIIRYDQPDVRGMVILKTKTIMRMDPEHFGSWNAEGRGIVLPVD